MKIQAPQYSGVESLGRANAGALSNVASAKGAQGSAQANVLNYMAKVGSEFIVRKENAEHDRAKTNTMLKMDAFEKQMGAREFYTADEAKSLPAGAVNVKNTDGSPRNNIPAYEVYPYLLDQAQQKIIEQESATITNPMLREEYLSLAQGIASKTNLKTALNAARQQQDYLREEDKDASLQLAINGKVGMSVKMIEEGDFSDLEKQVLIRERVETNEWEGDTRLLKTQDLESIVPRYNQLMSVDYGKGQDDFLGPGKSSGPYNVEANLRRFESVIRSVRGATSNANLLRYQEDIRSANNGNFDNNGLFKDNKQFEIIKNDPTLKPNQKNKLLMDAANAYYAGKVREATRLTPFEDDLAAINANAKLLQTIPSELNDEQTALDKARREAYNTKITDVKKDAAGYLGLFSPAVRVLAAELRDPEIQKSPERFAPAMRNYLHMMRAEQQMMGLTPQEVNFLPASVVEKFKQTAANINKDPLGVTKLVAQMETFRAQYGKEYPAVYGQLMREKALKPEHIMGDVIRDSSLRIKYIQAVENQSEMQKTPFYKSNLKKVSNDVARATMALKATLYTSGAMPTVAEGLSMNEQVNAFENGLVQMVLAEGYATNIYNSARAAQLANKVIEDNWDIYGDVRVPKGQKWDNDNVEKGLRYLRMTRGVKLSPELTLVGGELVGVSPADNQKKLRERFRSFATPSTNQDESGIVFKYNSGDPVLVLKRGRVVPLTLSFDELETFGAQRSVRSNYFLVID